MEGELDTALLCIALLFLLVKRGANLFLLAELVTYWFCGISFAGTCWHLSPIGSLSNLSIALATLCRNSAIPIPEF